MKHAAILPTPSGTFLVLRCGTRFPLRAWTGGPDWRPHRSSILRQARRAFFRASFVSYRCFWGEAPDRSTRALLWQRAYADAFATLTH